MTCRHSRPARRSIASTTRNPRSTRRAGWSPNGSTITWCAATAVPPLAATASELFQPRADQRKGTRDGRKADRRAVARKHLALAEHWTTALCQREPHEADGLFRALAARPGDTGHGHGDVRMR